MNLRMTRFGRLRLGWNRLRAEIGTGSSTHPPIQVSGLGVRYGKDSREYEMAEGRRKSERQRRQRRQVREEDMLL